MKQKILVLLSCLASPALAENARQLDAHEHGVGALNIAFDGASVAMELHAPGADIVGFEYAAESDEDRAAVEAAVAALARPLELFEFPASAQCSVTQASAVLESEEEHDAHSDEHDDHADHDEHDDHEEHEEDHAEEAGHTEFHAEYLLTCDDMSALTSLSFPYFSAFENARELEIQIVTASGAQAFEVERSSPELDLRGMF